MSCDKYYFAVISNQLQMASSLYYTRMQGIMVIVFIKTNIQSKMMKTFTMIPARASHTSNWPSSTSQNFCNFVCVLKC